MRFTALLLLAAAVPAFAADPWIRLTTPHFELYTTAGEKAGRQAILSFEQVRSFFTEIAPVSGGTEFPVRIIIFKNEKEYKPYAANAVAFAYFTSSRSRDYIVMQTADLEHFPTAIHEYMHLIVRHSGLALPLWLNEGWADVYSTLKPVGGKTVIGELVPRHVEALMEEKWLSLDALTGVNEKSPSYNETKRAGIFYAESWALVHMLYLAPDYKQRFPEFVGALLRSKSFGEASQSVYGRSAAQVYADLQNYLTRNMIFGAAFPVKLTKSEAEAASSPVSPFESDLMLADLLATINKRAEAQAALERIEKLNPDRPEVPESLGYLAWQNGNDEAARGYFEKAFAAGDDDPQMCFNLARMESAANQPNEKIIAILQRALKTRPDYIDARVELGLVQVNAHNYQAALDTFNQLRDLPSSRAAMVLNSMAFAYTQTGDLAQARKHALDARKWDRTDTETSQTDDLIRYLDEREAAAPKVVPAERPTLRRDTPALPREKLEHAEGIAKAIDCGGKSPHLVMLAGQKTLTFDIADPDKILLKHNGNGTFDFACGPQKPFPVVIEYVPESNAATPGIIGAIRTIEF